MTTTTTRTHTLTDLARHINEVIEKKPDRTNPTSDYLGDSCVYYLNDGVEVRRCLIGQALYEMTGLNVPPVFEEATISTLLSRADFCEYFSIDADDRYLHDAIFEAQREADSMQPWGSIEKINLDEA